MSRPHCLVGVMLAALLCGCGADPTPAQRFDESHGGKTVTPHGTVVQGSAQNTEGGNVEYSTEDGKTWKVQPREDGSYGPPEQAKSQDR